MDDGDIEYELAKMEEADRRREAPPEQPQRTVYRPVDPGLQARILRQMGQPYDKNAISPKESFYLNGWDNGDDEDETLQVKPAPSVFTPSRGGERKSDIGDADFDPWKNVWRPDWGKDGNVLAEPRSPEYRSGRDDTIFPSRGAEYRPLSYAASGHDVGTHMKAGTTPNPYAGGYADGGAYGDMLLSNVTPQTLNKNAGGTANPDLTDEQKLFIATVAGEAGGSSEAAQRAVAHVIMNRVGYKDWKEHDTVGKLLTPDQFSSVNDPNNQPFQEMTAYLKNRDGSNPRLEKMINATMNVYHKKEPDFTGGAVMFYSPKAQEQLHRERPDLYPQPKPSDWNFDELQKLLVPGAEDDDFLFYRYK